jgi:hypothetical protein
MLIDAAAPRIVADAPWLLFPALALVITVALVHWGAIARRGSFGSVFGS